MSIVTQRSIHAIDCLWSRFSIDLNNPSAAQSLASKHPAAIIPQIFLEWIPGWKGSDGRCSRMVYPSPQMHAPTVFTDGSVTGATRFDDASVIVAVPLILRQRHLRGITHTVSNRRPPYTLPWDEPPLIAPKKSQSAPIAS